MLFASMLCYALNMHTAVIPPLSFFICTDIYFPNKWQSHHTYHRHVSANYADK